MMMVMIVVMVMIMMMMMMDDKFLRHDLVVFRDPIVLRWLQQYPIVAVFGWYPVSRGAEVEYLLDS